MICSSRLNTQKGTRDARDVPVTCSSAAALDLFETALTQYQSYTGDPIATIDQALRQAPDFILGHVFKATVLMTFSEQRFVRDAGDSVAAAGPFLEGGNTRERLLAQAASKLVNGDWDGDPVCTPDGFFSRR
jgi:hypothetical protein